jgi:hypothetical protein
MCLALYIAASKPLPVIPRNPKKPAFHVVPLPENMQEVRALLPYPHIYYVGSHEGCSCAFNYEHEFRSALELRDYLRKALTVVDEISPSGVALPEFFFQDGQRLLFRSRKTMEAQRRNPPQAVGSDRNQSESARAV